jgi:hypothetical protein
VDEAVLSRLRHAIAAEDGDEEEQLNGVLRMLGAEVLDKTQIAHSPRDRQAHKGHSSKA